jgi:hypothetical protein
MMIRDDDIDSESFCMFDRFDISRSAVDRDDEFDIFTRELIKKISL